jgi:hypothetical protein
VQEINTNMKRPVRTLLCGLGLGAFCIGLIAIPNAFNPMGDHFNNGLPLVWFLGLSMSGLLMSLILGLWAGRHLERQAVLITWCSTTLLAVALPAPAIAGYGGWADGLICWYVPTAVIIGALWGWSFERLEESKKHNRVTND